MTFRKLSVGHSGLLALFFACVLGGTTLYASRAAFALDEIGRHSQEDPGGGSGLELTNPGDDDQPTISKRRQRVISAEAPEGDMASAPQPVRAAGSERVQPITAGNWVRVAFELWLGMLR